MSVQPTKQERHSEEMRNRILETAAAMFREYGFDKVSVRDIAATLGVTTGTLYHHFKNKQELFMAIGRKKGDFMRSSLLRFQETDHPLEDLEEFLCNEMTARILEDGYEFTQYRVLHSMQIGGRKGGFDQCVAALVRRAIELGELPAACDAETTADYFLWLYRGVVYRYCVSKEPLDLQAEMIRAVKIGICGIKQIAENR